MVTYSKLRDGSWGLRGNGLVAGATVTVVKRDGSARSECVGRVLWTGDGVAIATIASAAGGASRRRGGGCRGCGGPIRDASHHPAMGGLCGSCAFDEYDC